MAVAASGRYFDSRGTNWPSASSVNLDTFGGTQRFYDIQGVAKWEPTVKGTLTGFVEYVDSKGHRPGNLPAASPNLRFVSTIKTTFADNTMIRQKHYELAYYHRFNPQAAFLAYYSRLNYPYRSVQPVSHSSNIDFGLGPLGFPSFPIYTQTSLYQTFDRTSNNIQAQQHLRLSLLGQHSLIGGFDYLTGPGIDQRRFQNSLTTIDTTSLALFGVPPALVDESHTQRGFQTPQWSYSFYLLDYWRPV